MRRHLLVLVVLFACSYSAMVAQNQFLYLYHSGECAGNQQFWSIIAMTSTGNPVRTFGVSCRGEYACDPENEGAHGGSKIDIVPGDLTTELRQNAITLTSTQNAEAWFINAQTRKAYSMNQVKKGERTTIDMTDWPYGIYVVFTENDGKLLGFRRFEHF